MKKFFRELLSDNGNISSMRFMALLCVLAAITMALSGKPDYEPLLYAAFGGKFLQSTVERKESSKDKEV
jgi:hypothetical protein